MFFGGLFIFFVFLKATTLSLLHTCSIKRKQQGCILILDNGPFRQNATMAPLHSEIHYFQLLVRCQNGSPLRWGNPVVYEKSIILLSNTIVLFWQIVSWLHSGIVCVCVCAYTVYYRPTWLGHGLRNSYHANLWSVLLVNRFFFWSGWLLRE